MAKLKDRIFEIMEDNADKDGNIMSYQAFADRVNQIEVENSAKLTKSFVADIINGTRQPKAQTIVRISKAFNISTDYLLGVTDIKTSANDDINIAAKTTGLSTDIIKMLSKIAHIKGVSPYIYLAIEQLLIDYIYYATAGFKANSIYAESSYLSLLGRFWHLIKHNSDDDILDYEKTISFRDLDISISAETFTREIIWRIEKRLEDENRYIIIYKARISAMQDFIDELYENSQIMDSEIYERELSSTSKIIAKEHEQVIKRLDFSKTPDLEKRVQDLIKEKGGRRNGKH